jgi:hypothetical protein
MFTAVARDPAPPSLPIPDPPEPPMPHDPAHGSASAFAAVLQSLAHEVQGGESLARSALGAARAGRALGPAELIALQAGIYRYGDAVDLASRLVDRATAAVKTVMQGSA